MIGTEKARACVNEEAFGEHDDVVDPDWLTTGEAMKALSSSRRTLEDESVRECIRHKPAREGAKGARGIGWMWNLHDIDALIAFRAMSGLRTVTAARAYVRLRSHGALADFCT